MTVTVSDKLYPAIGSMVVGFQTLEHNIIKSINVIIDEEDTRKGYTICSQLSYQRLCKVWESLMPEYVERCKEDLVWLEVVRELVKKAGKLEEKRNKVIHSLWTVGLIEKEPVILRVKEKIAGGKNKPHRFQRDIVYTEISEVEDLAEECKRQSSCY